MGTPHFSQQTARYHRVSTLDQLEIFTRVALFRCDAACRRGSVDSQPCESGVGYQRTEQVIACSRITWNFCPKLCE